MNEMDDETWRWMMRRRGDVRMGCRAMCVMMILVTGCHTSSLAPRDGTEDEETPREDMGGEQPGGGSEDLSPSACSEAQRVWLCEDASHRAQVCEADGSVVARQACEPTQRCEEGDGQAVCADVEVVCARDFWRCDGSEALHFCANGTVSERFTCEGTTTCVLSAGEPVCEAMPDPEPEPEPEPGPISSGLGDPDHALEFILSWRGGYDADLYVTTPEGVTISYSRDDLETGGTFRNMTCRSACADDYQGYDQVFWSVSRGAMPSPGTYSITALNYDAPETLTVLLEVWQLGKVIERHELELAPGRMKIEPLLYTY